MQRISISFAILTTLLVIIFVMQLMAVSVYAQSTKPLAPKFTIQIPNNSTIQLVVENQAFTNSSSVNSIVYYFRVKDHNSGSWLKSGNYNLQSNSKTTIISIPPLPGMSLLGSILSSPLLRNSTLLDFQIQAKTGYYAITQKPGYIPGMPPLGSGDGYSEITFNPAETSDWSNTQTINLNQTSTTSPTPSVPEFPAASAMSVLFTSAICVAVLFRRKTK
jgi:hypothetical protein